MTVTTISPPAACRTVQERQKIDLIDVRTPVEFREVHVEIARNVPLDQLDPATVMQARNGINDEPLYLICRSGSRGQQACEKFLRPRASPTSSTSRAARWPAWKPACRSSVARRRSRWSGRCASQPDRWCCWASLLGWLVHPAFLGLSAFVGAGLVFAGITDTCGMGMMLARMPWNQVQGRARPTAVQRRRSRS